jgi:hypothetical protein
MSERQPELAQIVSTELGQDVEIDVVLDERRRVLPEPDPGEPLSDSLRRVLLALADVNTAIVSQL